MNRIHAPEWEDFRWFPASWRDYGTDYLKFIATKFNIYEPLLPIIKRGLAAAENSQWVDCASGGGSGLPLIARAVRQDYPGLKIVLTDYYPNIKAFESIKNENPQVFDFERQAVNALDLPPQFRGWLRTLFGSFHHFRPAEAQKILQNAVDQQSPIAIFEPVGRNPASFIAMLFVILNVLLFTPFIRPVRWEVLPFIYLIPIVPLYIMWDGFASILRTYSEKELKKLLSSLQNADSFDWKTGKKQSGPMPMYYLLGIPKK